MVHVLLALLLDHHLALPVDPLLAVLLLLPDLLPVLAQSSVKQILAEVDLH